MRNWLLAVMMCLGNVVFAQQTIKGTVTDTEGKPLENVTVALKGTKVATITNSSGAYSIAVSGSNPLLIFSSVGYIQRELSPKSGTVLNVVLQLKVTESEEVVVIGYGTVKKKDLTGSVARVDMADIVKAPVASFDQALAGRIAGVQVNSTDGQPGNSINIVVRGPNSVSQSNAPLYVVDGFPIEDMDNNTLNPADIESIEVLKDASATAIYGARGANGVIMITTKRGKTGAPTVKYSGYFGVQQNIKKMRVLSPYDYIVMQLEMNPSTADYAGAGSTVTPRQLYLSGGTTLNYYKDTASALDYQGQIFQPGYTSSHTISVTGGNDKTKYAFSGNYFDQNGIIITSAYKRYQGRFSLDQTINNKLKVGLNANYSYMERSGLSVGASTGLITPSLNLMYSVWGSRPVNASPQSLAFLKNPDLDFTEDSDTDPLVGTNNDYRFNPYKSLKNTINRGYTKDLISNGYIEYKFLPSLLLKITGGIDDRIVVNQVFYGSGTAQGSFLSGGGGPNGSIMNNRFTSILNENYLTYTKKIQKDHDLSAMIGMSNQQVKTSSDGFSATNVPNEKLGIAALGQGTAKTITSLSSSNTLASFLGRVNYSYKSKYLLTLSYRADGSSKFSSDNRWAYFPSGAFAWRISRESFMDNLKNVISDAKLKITYGKIGNNRVTDFAYLSVYNQDAGAAYTFNNQAIYGAYVSSIGNSKLKWETTASTDLGLEIAFFKNRIALEAEVYNKLTSDLLLYSNIPTSTGYSRMYQNMGRVRNRGLELALNTTNIQNKNFTWRSSFNISFNRNKLLELTENQESLGSAVGPLNNVTNYIAKIGQPLGLMYGLIADGLYQFSDFNLSTAGTYVLKNEVPTNGNTRALIQPGDIKYKDLNGDGIINVNDYTVIGRSLPVHNGGFTNNLKYKNFDLNIFFQWSAGNDIMNYNNYVFMGGTTTVNQYEEYKNRWTPDNTNTNIARAKGFNGSFSGASTYYIEDGSFLRLKTLSLGYELPASLLNRIKIKAVRVYSSVQNVITWTKYSGQDPEVSLYNSALTGGFDYSSYPRSRTITFGIDVSF